MLKIVLFYNQNNRGWSETWWANGSSPPVTLSTTDKNIFTKAIYFRAPLTTLEWVRYSVVGSPQKVTSFRMSNKVASALPSTTAPDVASTDALWRISSATFARRTISLRGLPDDSVARNPTSGAFEPSANLTKNVDAYISAVEQAGWLLRVTQTPVNTPALPQVNVGAFQSVVGDTTKTTATCTGAIPGLVAGDKVRFTGFIDPKQLPLLPRTPTVLTVVDDDPTTFRFAYQMPNELLYAPTTVKMTKLLFNWEPIADWDFQSLSKRDTGRPFGSSRGRRSAAGSRR